MALSIIILAAGKGTRMNSPTPKVLHTIGGLALLRRVVNTARQLSADIHVVYGYQGDTVREAMADLPIHWVEQREQLGTGHAVKVALDAMNNAPPSSDKTTDETERGREVAHDTVLVLYGDVPLISFESLRALLALREQHDIALLTAELAEPKGYGRIVRDSAGYVRAIVEEKDATIEQRGIPEVNSGIMALDRTQLAGWMTELRNNNEQAEYYLTDMVEICTRHGGTTAACKVPDAHEILGVNSQWQRTELERYYQQQRAQAYAMQGLGISDAARFDIYGHLTFGKGVFIAANVEIRGDVVLGDGVQIGANSILDNCRIGAETVIKPFSMIERSVVESHCTIGPYARIRPDSHLHHHSQVGNFVEVKKSTIGEDSKVNHLSYVGDTTIGKAANIGAGTITCNYDGRTKHATHIGDQAFIGSGTQLVAPVSIGNRAVIGAGSTITADVPSQSLGIARSAQTHIANWQPKSHTTGNDEANDTTP